MIFVCPVIFGIIDQDILPHLIALQFDLAAVLFLTSNTSVNIRSDFVQLVLLTVTEESGDIGMFEVKVSGAENISVSRIALYCCWS